MVVETAPEALLVTVMVDSCVMDPVATAEQEAEVDTVKVNGVQEPQLLYGRPDCVMVEVIVAVEVS